MFAGLGNIASHFVYMAKRAAVFCNTSLIAKHLVDCERLAIKRLCLVQIAQSRVTLSEIAIKGGKPFIVFQCLIEFQRLAMGSFRSVKVTSGAIDDPKVLCNPSLNRRVTEGCRNTQCLIVKGFGNIQVSALPIN